MIDYLIPRVRTLVVLDQPIRTDPDLHPVRTEYHLGDLVETREYWASKRFLYLADMIACWKAADRNDFDLFIAGEQLNGLVANYKSFRWVYVPSDVSDHGRLHEFVKKRADAVWDLKAMPGLCPPIREENYKPRDGNVFGYLGALEPRFGVDKAIEAMPLIWETIPDAHLEIVGSGPQRLELEKMAQKLGENAKLGYGDRIRFYGFLPDDEAVKVLLRWKAGLAPYSGAFPGLDSSKIRYYAWCGVPMVVSSLTPQNCKLVEKYGAGWAKHPEPEAIAEGVLSLMVDGKGPRHGCRELADSFNSERYFKKLFSELPEEIPS